MIQEHPPFLFAHSETADQGSGDSSLFPGLSDALAVDRPTVRTIALAAGVSAITVSRALRNHPRVAPSTLARVQEIARQVGYRPDPHIGQLMHYLRRRKRPAFQATLCALTDVPPGARSPFTRLVLTGARAYAETRGYACSVLNLAEQRGSPGSLDRMLKGRGVEGLILLPMARSGDLTQLVDWRAFSTVAATNSAFAPEIHAVAPHHLKNIQLLCDQLEARGYRRIGFVSQRDDALRENPAYAAGILWHTVGRGADPVRPFIYCGPNLRTLKTWFNSARPDVIVTNTARLARALAGRLGVGIPGPVGFALTDVASADDCFAGIDERPADIGAAAIDLLASMVQRGERGVPEISTSTLISGRWRDGPSCRRLPTTAACVSSALARPPGFADFDRLPASRYSRARAIV